MDYKNFKLPALTRLLAKNLDKYTTMRYDGSHNGKDFRKEYTQIEENIDSLLDAIKTLHAVARI